MKKKTAKQGQNRLALQQGKVRELSNDILGAVAGGSCDKPSMTTSDACTASKNLN